MRMFYKHHAMYMNANRINRKPIPDNELKEFIKKSKEYQAWKVDSLVKE